MVYYLVMSETLIPYLNLQALEEIAQVNRMTREVDGWLTELEGAALYIAAKHCIGNGVIVEIGSFKGKSTTWLASASKKANRGLVYAIDNHLGSLEHQAGGKYASHMPPEGTTEFVFRKNIRDAGLENWVKPIISTSLDALKSWSYPIKLLFIDADHAYQAVRDDFLSWEKYVVLGGLIVFHDVDRWNGSSKILDGPTKVVYEDAVQTGLYSTPIIVNHLAFVSKIRQSLPQ